MALAAALLLAPPALLLVPVASAEGGPKPQLAVSVTEVTQLQYNGRIAQVAYSPDGLFLAVAVADGPVLILNATTFAEEANLTTPPSWISPSSLSWGPASDKVGVGYAGGAVGVWRVPSGSAVWNRTGLNFDVRGVAWSPDGRFLAAGIVHSIFVYWGASGYLNSTLSLDYGGSQPAGLSWSHDSDFIAVGQQAYAPSGAILALFDAASWGKSLGWRWVGPGMDNVAFEGRARFLGVQLGASRVEVWEVRNWSLFATLSSASGLEQFAWTHDGSRLVLLETEPSALPNETEDFGGFEVLHLGGGSNNSTSMSASPSGETVAVGHEDGSLSVLSVAGDRFFDDLTPLKATTGDPLTFSVRSNAAGPIEVTFTDAQGGRPTTATLTGGAGAFSLTVTVPSDWVGPLLYRFEAPSAGVASPERLVRVSDNDAPTLLAWNFTRLGADGETGQATATVADNIGLTQAAFQMAIDGVVVASSTSGPGSSADFSLSAPLAPESRTVRLELSAVDAAGNGGAVFATQISLSDLTAPRFGADLSLPGTAGGRILLGTVATDERGAPVVALSYRELDSVQQGPWTNFTFGAPPPGSSNYSTTFALARTTVAVEYSFEAVDASGNRNATSVRVQPVFDREPPEFLADLSDREATTGDPFHLGLLARDNIAVASVRATVQLDAGTPQQLNLTPWAAFGPGAFEATVAVGQGVSVLTYLFVVFDESGNTVGTGTRIVRVLDNDPPSIALLSTNFRVTAGEDYVLSAEVSDPSGVGNLTFYWRREGGSAFFQKEAAADARFDRDGLPTARFLVSFDDVGIVTFRDGRGIEFYLFANDLALNSATLGGPTDPRLVTVLDGADPTARFTTQGEPYAGSLLSFDATPSEDDLGIVSYAWTVDGAPAGDHVSLGWSFQAAGRHEVRLTVADASGRSASTTQLITVSAPPPVSAGVGSSALWLLAIAGAAAAGFAVWYALGRRKRPE